MKRFKSQKKFKRKKIIKRNTNKYCKFTAEGVDQIDYKDIDTLKNTLLKLGKLSQAGLLEQKVIIKSNWRQQ